MAKIETHLPDYYKKSRYFKHMGAAGDKEFERLHARIEQVDRNSVVDTADEDGLKAFERDFRLNPANDTTEVRKARVKAKKRSPQPIIKDNFISSLKIFDPDADVEPHISEYSFDVKLKAPEMLTEVMAQVEEIKPAHLGVGYAVKPASVNSTLYFSTVMSIHGRINIPTQQYNTFDDIKDMTFNELRGKTYKEILYKE